MQSWLPNRNHFKNPPACVLQNRSCCHVHVPEQYRTFPSQTKYLALLRRSTMFSLTRSFHMLSSNREAGTHITNQFARRTSPTLLYSPTICSRPIMKPGLADESQCFSRASASALAWPNAFVLCSKARYRSSTLTLLSASAITIPLTAISLSWYALW